MYRVWVEAFPGQRMYHFWVYFGTFPVPGSGNRKTDTPKWNNDVPKQSQTWYNDCTKKGKDRLFLHLCTNMRPRLTQIWAETGTWNGSLLKEKGMALRELFLEQAAQNLTVQSKVCVKNFLVNIVYKFCK